MKLIIESTRAYTYPGQCNPQDRHFEIDTDTVTVSADPEIGNAVPMRVWNQLVLRVQIPHGYSRSDITTFYADNRADFARVSGGLGERYDGNNYVGTLSEDGRDALDTIEYAIYSSN